MIIISPLFTDHLRTPKVTVWNNLTQIISSNQVVLLGDFNQVKNNKQKLRGSMVIKEASQFMDWKMDDKLLDIPFHGVNYT